MQHSRQRYGSTPRAAIPIGGDAQAVGAAELVVDVMDLMDLIGHTSEAVSVSGGTGVRSRRPAVRVHCPLAHPRRCGTRRARDRATDDDEEARREIRGRSPTGFLGIAVTGNQLAAIGIGFVVLDAAYSSLVGALPDVLAVGLSRMLYSRSR